MRVKRLAIRKMPKKQVAGRGKKDGADQSPEKMSSLDCNFSKCSIKTLERLVEEGLLQPKEIIKWRPSFREPFPLTETHEIVLFSPWVERGFALPGSDFLNGLLYYFDLDVHHLTANSIIHLSIFTHLCEAFLGIEPHWDLFRYFFHVKPHPVWDNCNVVGGAGIQLRQKTRKEYLEYKLPSNVDWRDHWFYIENHAPPLPEQVGRKPIFRKEWNLEVSSDDLYQVTDLVKSIAALKEIGVTGASVMYSFFSRRIQPLQKRE